MKQFPQVAALAFLLAAGAFYSCDSSANKKQNQDNYPSRQVSNPNQTDVGEGVALAYIAAIDNHEINAANEAQKKKMDAPVDDYAKMLQREHTQNLDKTMQVSDDQNLPLKETDEVNAMKRKGADELSMMSSKTGKDFQMAYVNAMIMGHQEALDLIDNKLIPSCKNEMVLTHLRDTRDHVAMHLEQARKLSDKQKM